MDQIGQKLLSDMRFINQLNMKKEFLQGKRYSIRTLNNMDEFTKVNYINEMLLYDEKVSRHVAQIHANVLKEHINNAEV